MFWLAFSSLSRNPSCYSFVVVSTATNSVVTGICMWTFPGLILNYQGWASGLSCVSRERNSARHLVFLYLSFPFGNNLTWQNQIRQHMLYQEEYWYVSDTLQLCSCEYLVRCNSRLKCFQPKPNKNRHVQRGSRVADCLV